MDLLSLGLFFIIFILIPGIAVTVFWLWMLVDALKRKYKNKSDKLMWVIVIVFAHIFGAIIYYFLVRRKTR